jgi:hypothetical protein
MSEPAHATTYTRDALEHSAPFDGLRALVLLAGTALLDDVSARLAARGGRTRALRSVDAERQRATLDALLANLVMAIFNRVDSRRFVAVSFNRNHYSGAHLSVTALARLRDGLLASGLVEGQRGYRRMEGDRVVHARMTRLRATRALRDLIADHGVTRRNVGWSAARDIILLREPQPDPGPEPTEVVASRNVLVRMNDRLARTDIALPEDSWTRIVERHRASPGDDDHRILAGDTGAVSLARIFKGNWQQGGRLYGGWWINLPKRERTFLTIDGEPTVECDFARLHPTLLFARLGLPLDHDIYTLPGFSGPEVRNLGKRLFNRLINKTSAGQIRLPVTALDRAQLPAGVSFHVFQRAFIANLAPLERWFGTGEGLKLQREDSDLAIDVLDLLLKQDVIALPVHDSFIVASHHRDKLIAAMSEAFLRRYGRTPAIS